MTPLLKLISELSASGLPDKEIADAMFPTNKYPVAALKRLQNGETSLEVDHVLTAARLVGFDPREIFESQPTSWRLSLNQHNMVFSQGEFSATLNTSTWQVRLTKGPEVILDWALTKPVMPLKDFIEHITTLANEYQDNN